MKELESIKIFQRVDGSYRIDVNDEFWTTIEEDELPHLDEEVKNIVREFSYLDPEDMYDD